MPNWKKLIVSGSDANLNSLDITTELTASDALITNDLDVLGNVGIGTTSPSNKLQVSGNIFATGNITAYGGANDSSVLSTSGTLQLRNSGNTNVNIQSAGNSYFNGGNVGIGTTSPGQKLDVAGSIRTNNQLTVYNSDLSKQSLRIKSEATTNTGLFKLSNGSNWGLLMKGDGNNPYIGAYFGGSLNITGFEDSEGTTPSTTKLAEFVFGGTGGGSGYLNLNGDLKVNTNKKIQFGYANSQTNGIEWVAGSKISAAITPVDTANFSRTGLGFFTGDFSDGTTNADERMRITRAGNVGIGTTTPSAILNIVNSNPKIVLEDSDNTGTFGHIRQQAGNLQLLSNNNTANGTIQFKLDNGTTTTDAMYIASSGNVGIGTTSPTEKLQVTGNVSASGDFIGTNFTGSSFTGSFVGDGSGLTGLNSGSWDGIFSGSAQITGSLGVTGSVLVDGNVGIGTTTPNHKLSVAGGNIEVNNGGATWFGSDATGGFARTFNGNSFRFISSANSETMRINNATGNVGIGTTSPGAKLEINSVDNIAAILNSSNTFTFLDFEKNGANRVQVGNASAGDFIVRTSDLERMRIASTGNVGIGTTSPTQLLDVTGADAEIVINDSNDTPALRFRGSGVTSAMVEVNSAKDMFFKTGGVTEQMRITSGGNVGIGTTSPQSKLHVLGTTTLPPAGSDGGAAVFGNTSNTAYGLVLGTETSGKSYIQSQRNDGTATTYDLLIQPNGGNVGIGTTSPSQKLQVTGNVSASGDFIGTNFTGSSFTGSFVGDGSGLTGLNSGSWDGIFSGSAQITGSLGVTGSVLVDGNVGIGTTSPSTNLEVVTSDPSNGIKGTTNTGVLWGNFINTNSNTFPVGKLTLRYGATETVSIRALSNEMRLGNLQTIMTFYASSSEKMRIHSNGNVGIGTTSPSAKLDVAGTGNFTGLVSGITPVNAANFVTKAYVDGSGGGTGPFLPLAGGTLTGNLTVDGGSITVDPDTTGAAFTWKESDSTTVAGQLRGYGNRGDIYLYSDGTKTTEISAISDSFIPALHIGGTSAASGGVLQVTGTATATTFSGDLNGTINTATTAVTKPNATDDTTVATTAFVQNLIGTIPAGLVFQGTWNAATNSPTLASGTGTTGHFYIVSTDGSTNLDGITDWKVGDWAVFVEQGATDAWEKVDNSSVLDGSGTGQTVALWGGSGTSNTLTDAPITVSGNNTTFAGNVSTSGNSLHISSRKFISRDGNGTGLFADDATSGLSIADNGNATFTGNISASGDIRTEENLEVGYNNTNYDQQLILNNGLNKNYIFTSNSASINNAQLTIQGGNYTHAVNFKDSYSNQDNYATLQGGYVNDSKLILFNSSSQLTTTLSTGDSSFAGNVGIGTNSPSARLEVSADVTTNVDIAHFSNSNDIAKAKISLSANSSGELSLIDGSNNTDVFITSNGDSYFNGGEVLIGTTTSTGAKLIVDHDNTKMLELKRSGNTKARFIADSNHGQLDLYNSATANTIRLLASGDSYLNGGNVGIGTTSPSQKLQVVSDSIIMADFTTTSTKGGISISEADEGGYLSTEANRICLGSAIGISNDNLTYHMGTNSLGIGTTSPSQLLHVAGNVRVTGEYYDSSNSSGTAGQILSATLTGTDWIDNAHIPSPAPATPGSIVSTIVGETIEIAFNESTTSNIDYYQVWSSDDGGDYGIIAQITPTDFSSTMTVVDTTFVTGGTMSYRVYAVKSGVYSSPGTTSKTYTVGTLDVTDMTVINLNTAYYIQYEKPASRFIDHIEIYMDSQTTQGALNRSNASIVYSGQNPSFMKSVGVSNNFHQFWVEVVTT